MAKTLALVPPLTAEAARPAPAGYLAEITALLAGKSSKDILAACLMEGFSTEAALALPGALAVLEASAP